MSQTQIESEPTTPITINKKSFSSKRRDFHKPIKNLSLAALAVAMQADVPVVICGDPGTGKTESIKALAKHMNRYFVSLIGSNRDPTDFGGFPMAAKYLNKRGIEQDCFSLMPAKWALELADNPGGVLFIDELNTVPAGVQATLMRVILEKVVGEFQLPSNTIIVGAINPHGIATNGSDFAPPTANRLCHIDWSLDALDWCNGMANGFQMAMPPNLPDNWERDFLPESIGLITGFIHKSQHYLIQLPKSESERTKAWPSPRTWHFASRLLAASRSLYGEFSDVENILISGVIGAGVAHEFFAYLKNLDLPDVEFILNHPEKWEINLKRPDIVFSTISSVNSYYNFNKSVDNWFKVVNLYGQLAKKEIGLKDLAFVGLTFVYNKTNYPPGLESIMNNQTQLVMDKIGWMQPLISDFLIQAKL